MRIQTDLIVVLTVATIAPTQIQAGKNAQLYSIKSDHVTYLPPLENTPKESSKRHMTFET